MFSICFTVEKEGTQIDWSFGECSVHCIGHEQGRRFSLFVCNRPGKSQFDEQHSTTNIPNINITSIFLHWPTGRSRPTSKATDTAAAPWRPFVAASPVRCTPAAKIVALSSGHWPLAAKSKVLLVLGRSAPICRRACNICRCPIAFWLARENWKSGQQPMTMMLQPYSKHSPVTRRRWTFCDACKLAASSTLCPHRKWIERFRCGAAKQRKLRAADNSSSSSKPSPHSWWPMWHITWAQR